MPAKCYFTPQLLQFLRQLKRNNNRDWFLRNKESFELVVKQPCLRFILDVGFELRKISPWIKADPRPNGGSLFRIYRDIRFSKDKKPYKTHMGMQFLHAGVAKDVHAPCYYLHLEPGNCFVAAGSWHPDSRSLAKIRDAIAWQQDEWKKTRHGLRLEGDTLSRPPRGYGDDHPFIEDLKRKDFVAAESFIDEEIYRPNFMPKFISSCRNMAPLVGFLSKALGLGF